MGFKKGGGILTVESGEGFAGGSTRTCARSGTSVCVFKESVSNSIWPFVRIHMGVVRHPPPLFFLFNIV